jgi:phage terminase Nu1 subunit (DNA packaging protein)
MTEIVTKAELALELEVSRPRISQFVQRGMPVRRDGRVDLLAACRWLVTHLDDYYAADGSRALTHARALIRLLEED